MYRLVLPILVLFFFGFNVIALDSQSENDTTLNANPQKDLEKYEKNFHSNKYLNDDNEVDVIEDFDVGNIPSLEGNFQGWRVLTMRRGGRKICYTVTFPFSKIGNHKSSRDPYLMVSYIGFKKQEVSIATGYEFRRNSKPNISIDGIQFSMVVKKNVAWANDNYSDLQIIRAMLRGTKFMIRAESLTGTYSVDMYSLEGFADAYTKMLQMCQK